jgi:hypothetical protein
MSDSKPKQSLENAPDRAEAKVAKEFFVHMITKDILLEDCLLDLIDNSIDGASRVIQAREEAEPSPRDSERRLEGFGVQLDLRSDSFAIRDNCGGIPLEDARHYAFHFGRKAGTEHEPEGSIGLYGIGMKRALFKIGKRAQIHSSTEEESFNVVIDVPHWEGHDVWNFPLFPGSPSGNPGTVIEIADLNPGIGEALEDPVFVNRLRKSIARDYSIFLQSGFEIKVNGIPIEPIVFAVKEGAGFQPGRLQYREDGISVELIAGMAAPPPDDPSAQTKVPTEMFGWYVLCNDRVVIAADKTSRTVWGHGDFNTWHPQYNGFLGIISFHSKDPNKLPWTTTKRAIDLNDPMYRRAVPRMKELTETFIDYTEARKEDLGEAKRHEQASISRPVAEIPVGNVMTVPRLTASTVQMATIQYRKPREEVQKVAKALGNRNMNYKQVGIETFDYFRKREVED